MATPHVCPLCKGIKDPSCHPCSGLGIVWDREGSENVSIAPRTPSVPLGDLGIPFYPEPPNYPTTPATPWHNPVPNDLVISWQNNQSEHVVAVIKRVLEQHLPLNRYCQ